VDATVVELEGLELRDDRELLSPPWLAEPLYQCATAVTVHGFVPHADIDVDIDGTVVVSAAVDFPEPVGATLTLPPLVAGQVVRARQHHSGLTSEWSPPVPVRDHTAEYPAGPPRPQVNPAPVLVCGSRTGVGNLLGGGNVWITADGVEVGRVDGCATPQQGVNVDPSYGGPGQRVRAHFELCGDPSAPSLEHLTQPGPVPLPTPGFDPVYEGGEQLRVTGVANGAQVSITRDGTPLGTYRCWGGSLLVGLSPEFSAGESFSATQQLCPSDPPSDPGTGTVQPCSSLPAPVVGPVQAGDATVTVVDSAPGAQIRVYRNATQVGLGAAPVVTLTQALAAGDVVHVVQSLPGCPARSALQLTVACVDPPFGPDPSALDLYPVSSAEYADGPVTGSVYYPADDDGTDQPFNRRLAATGRVPIVVMAHGNHDPADPSYLGYDYFQHSLARMGMVAVSVDCNALNGVGGGVGNIEDRADLIIDSITHFQGLDGNPGSVFHERIDFDRLGLMGHSRGGDAVVTIPTVIGAIGVTIRAVLALAPTNFRYWFGLPTIAPSGYAYMTILPAGDGDVVDNNGAQFYDVAGPDPYKSQLYVHSTNHNFFNRRWLDDDAFVPVLDRGAHERILDVYGCAFFRSLLLGHPTHRFLDGTQRPGGAHTEVVHTAYMTREAATVDDHDDGNTIAVNSLGLPTTQSPGSAADEFPFDQVAGAYNDSFFGLTVGMVSEPQRGGAVFRSETGPQDVRHREVWLRVAEVARGALPAEGTGFELGLEDGSGTVGWISSDAVGGVPRPFDRPDRIKTMLSTLRFRPGCAKPVEGELDLADVRAILIRHDRRDLWPLAFDDLQVVDVDREV